MFYKTTVMGLVSVCALALSGCASKPRESFQVQQIPVASETSEEKEAVEISAGLPQDTSGLTLDERTIYFELDSDQISGKGMKLVGHFADYLMENPTTKLRLEGNADERGTTEYNVALGERRANAVERALRSKGVSSAQLDVISYGESRPAVQGNSEAAWSQNRRVELVQL